MDTFVGEEPPKKTFDFEVHPAFIGAVVEVAADLLEVAGDAISSITD